MPRPLSMHSSIYPSADTWASSVHFLSCFISFHNRLFLLCTWQVECSMSVAHLWTPVPVPACSSRVNGYRFQTHYMSPATEVGMPALGMSGLWVLGLGFPRPPCQRISFYSDRRECKTVPPLFSAATAAAAHIPLCFLHRPILLPSFPLPAFPSYPSHLLHFCRLSFYFFFSITSSTLLQPCVDEPEYCFFFFFFKKEEGLC